MTSTNKAGPFLNVLLLTPPSKEQQHQTSLAPGGSSSVSLSPMSTSESAFSSMSPSPQSPMQFLPSTTGSNPPALPGGPGSSSSSSSTSHLPPPFAGVCSICHQRIFNASDACQAMGKVYHNNCFVCCCCKRTLRGKVFYKDQGKVYCEDDYLYCGFQRRAEKCSSCGHIITDMILQAIGKSYHPGCFRCCVCNECLDGLPFTINSENRVYCVQDYHRVYAPRCESCGLPIIPDDGSDEIIRVVAMDRNFHIECFHCEDCGLKLTDEQESRCYPLTEANGKIHLLCRSCHLVRRENSVPASSNNSNSPSSGAAGGGGGEFVGAKSSPLSSRVSAGMRTTSPPQPPMYSSTSSSSLGNRPSPGDYQPCQPVTSSLVTHDVLYPSSSPSSQTSRVGNPLQDNHQHTVSSTSSAASTRTTSATILPSSTSSSPSSTKFSPLLRRTIPTSSGNITGTELVADSSSITSNRFNTSRPS